MLVLDLAALEQKTVHAVTYTLADRKQLLMCMKKVYLQKEMNHVYIKV